ncbi:MAG TPA: Type 1 glutamine amidotransferase-like domain-containing protein [Gemmatimonadaceae bacterium]|nr:Type 1 glutamine amidotransferase-like domain-containing protein [Gemmatimonadaceae bacterium]
MAGSTPSAAPHGPPIVGPPTGTVLVVGGGQQGPELYKAFIDAAGGPNALIVDIPTAGGDTVYPPDWRGTSGLKGAGARNVVVLHSNPNRKDLANSDSFVNVLRRAGGVWYEGGRQFHLVDSYGGTRTETEVMNVLRRGGVVGGSSAGASILGEFMVRGAPSNNNNIMEYPGYTRGFGYLRNTGIDQHVVARMRLPDVADSLVPRHPGMLFISEDEGTAWLVKGDVATILGRNKAFVYAGNDPTDPGRPFLTLYPGDKYDLGKRRLISRAIDQSPLRIPFVDSIFAAFNSNGGKATVHIAQEGRVLLARGYGIPPQPRFMPVTAVPNMAVGDIGKTFLAAAALNVEHDGKLRLDDPLPDGMTIRGYLTNPAAPAGDAKLLAALIAERSGGTYADMVQRRLMTIVGRQRTIATPDGAILSNVDELYRWELGLRAYANLTTAGSDAMFAPGGGKGAGNGLGWTFETYRGLATQWAYVAGGGKQGAYVRIPGHEASVIILTDQPGFDAKAAADRILDRLFFEYRDRSLFRRAPVASTSSCRSLSVANAQVAWAGCTGGKVFRTTDGGATWMVDSVPGAARLDFRGIKAFDASTAVVVSAGPAEQGQARIYRTTDGAKTWTLAWSDTTTGVFLDGVAFWDARNGLSFSDPVGGRFVILTTNDGGRSWARTAPDAIPANLPGEAAFAASNTQLAVQGTSNAWIATGGGPEARVFRTTDRGHSWSVASTGMPAGASSGLFGIAFADARNGVAIGGDYRNERGVSAFALRTRDGGASWEPAGIQRPDGTTSGVVHVPGTNPPMFVAVGQTGVAFSRDFGASWIHADTITAWGVGFASASIGFVAGARGHVGVLAQPIR